MNKSEVYKFQDPKEKLCFTCEHVYKDRLDILLVSHDEDGDWQFLCGEANHNSEKAVVLCLVHLTQIDLTINEVWNLPIGYLAERKSRNDKWKFYKE